MLLKESILSHHDRKINDEYSVGGYIQEMIHLSGECLNSLSYSLEQVVSQKQS